MSPSITGQSTSAAFAHWFSLCRHRESRAHHACRETSQRRMCRARVRIVLAVFGLSACSPPASPLAPSPPGVAHEAKTIDRGLEPAEPALRLPRNFLPASYAATLAIDPARSGFEGTIAITGDISQRSSVIWLHGRQLR